MYKVNLADLLRQANTLHLVVVLTAWLLSSPSLLRDDNLIG
jgi:hypothetical protein